MTRLLTYRFPLRPGLLVHIELPPDLTNMEVRRLQAFLGTLETPFPTPPIIGAPQTIVRNDEPPAAAAARTWEDEG